MKLKTSTRLDLVINHGTCNYICMYINAVANSVMLVTLKI